MGFDTSGYVLKAARSAPSNATSTAGAGSGVVREHADVPGSFVLPGSLVEVSADQYRASILEGPSGETQEYLFWAANTSNLAVVEDPAWAITQGSATIPVGTTTFTVGPTTYTDGTDRVFIADDGGRSIAAVVSLTIVRGDDPANPVVLTSTDIASQDGDAGVVVLNDAALISLGGGLSVSRGDVVSSVRYYLAAQKFWWTRNDGDLQRFGWDGVTQRWQPLRGSPPAALGAILSEVTVTLLPRPDRFVVGDYLPGDAGEPDTFAMVRVGQSPDADSLPAAVLVVSDAEAEATYAFAPGVDAVVGVTSGLLQWNPTFVASNAGRLAWYIFETFEVGATGVLGSLQSAGTEPLFIVPVPGLTEYPLIRLDTRRPLRAVAANTDAELLLLAVAEGEVGWSATTGKLKFSAVDVAKADPEDGGFDLAYLGTQVVYDGVSLTAIPVGTRQPVQLVDDGGVPTTVDGSKDLFVPPSSPLPAPGISGVMAVPDGTGVVPNTTAIPGTRPNGCGLVRSLEVEGDLFLFGKAGVIETLDVVEFNTDLPRFPFLLQGGNAIAARELDASGVGSKVAVSRKDRTTFDGEALYLLQATVQPLVFADQARLISKLREPFVLTGAEVLAFAVDGVSYLWSATGAGSFTAAEVAAELDALITGTGSARAERGRIMIQAGSASGSVEVGFGSVISGAFVDRDLSGCAVLGFLPGWRVDDPTTNTNWLPDTGFALGVYRSPQNLDRSQSNPDFAARGQLQDAVLSRSVLASPVFLLNNPPLRDVVGYGEGQFFQIVDGAYQRTLVPFQDVLYAFVDGRFSWLERNTLTAGIAAATSHLDLGATGVVADTLHPAVDAGNGLYLDADGGGLALQVLGEDYLLDQDGAPGIATLIARVGPLVATGALGAFQVGGTTFEDGDATFMASGVSAGYRLKLVGGDRSVQGSYVIADVLSETELEVEADVPFAAEGETVSWEVYEGVPASGYDPGLVADVSYVQFNHLLEEPFQIRVLSLLGATPEDASAQDADPLVAVVSDAVAHQRPMAVRFGALFGEDEASVTVLRRTVLGILVDGLAVPDVGNAHFVNGAFAILVGTTLYTRGSGLVGVSTFTNPLLGDQVEYGLPGSGIEGQLQFGADTLEELAEAYVSYVETFSAPADLAAGTAEVDPDSGELCLSAADMAAHAGDPAYFVEQMITEDREDVVLSPMQGAIFFNTPLRAFQHVEVSYYQADASGAKVVGEALRTEVLPLFVRLEVAARTTSYVYAFNPTGRTVREDVATQVWVGGRLQDYGNVVPVVVDAAASVIRFEQPVASDAEVRISYAVNETFGGEQGFTVSTPPVYRPPFFLEAGASTFSLAGDRTDDLVVGKLLRVGAFATYVQSASFDGDVTQVAIFPAPPREAGSRAPGNDILTLLSSSAVTTDVGGVPAGGDAGFLLTVAASRDPADVGMLSLVFHGDVTKFTGAGHLLEVGGRPYLSAGAQLSDTGRTTVSLTSPLIAAVDPDADVIRTSARPIYPPDARRFVGVGPVVVSEGVEVILFGESRPDGTPAPGRTLAPTQDYVLDAATGEIRFVSSQVSLPPNGRLYLAFVRERVLAPFLDGGSVVVPRYQAGYAHLTLPTEENGFLGAYLVARYAFSSPDTFYVRAVPMTTWMGEVAQIITERVAAKTPHGGPMVVSGPAQENWSYGTVPIQSQVRELQDQDRAARVFLGAYDATIRAFEQVLETIQGNVVGDRDGKFRFFVGRGQTYASPGYEDPISGEVNPRLIWSQVFEAANGSFGVNKSDPLVDPETATQDPVTRVVSGDAMNPWLLDFYVRAQRAVVQNDMDDEVLVGKGRVALAHPFSFKVPGAFKRMWEPSVISRLYPESTLAFTTTYPGLLSGTLPEQPGVYAFLKRIGRPKLLKGEGPVFGSTFGQDVGDVSNPVLGLVQNITGQVRPRARLPRARVWAYSPTGFPDIDPATDGKPAVIATPLPLQDVPVNMETGQIDVTRLAANGGDLQDLTTGDVALSTPRWDAYDDSAGVLPQLAFGRPSGETYAIGYAAGSIADAFSGAFPFATPTYKGIYVGGVYAGCVLTFTSGDGAEVTRASDVVRVGEDGVSTLPFEPLPGDTIYVIPPESADASGFSNPPSVADLKKFARQQPFLDLGVRERRSAFVDRSLPSVDDPAFPIKEIVNQRTAAPLQAVEADVEFVNTSRVPVLFPALAGEATNDSGDYGIPYLSIVNTELARLGAAQAALTAVVQDDGPLVTHAWLAVYPDEVLGNDGSVLAAAAGTSPPATLLSAADFLPVTTAGVYVAHSGIGDVRPYDLLLVEVGQADVNPGMTGLLSVGAVSTDTVEPPRFVSPTQAGDRIRYAFTNAMTHVSTTGTTGVVIQENGAITTTFDVSTVAGLYLNDGSGGVTGGLNDVVSNGLFAYPNNNRITLNILDQGTGLLLEQVIIQGGNVTGGLGTVGMLAAPIISSDTITITAVGFVDFAALGGAAPGPVGPLDFTVSVDTFVSPLTTLTGSATAFVGTDRLTFSETLDLSTVRPRGATTTGGVSIQGELSVHRVTSSGSPLCTVNAPNSVNGGSAFTFLARDAGAPDSIGTFDPSPGTGLGSVKVMAFEGDGNAPIPSSGSFTFSAIPSSDQAVDGPVLSGTGDVHGGENRVRDVVVSAGSLERVVPGDVLVITGSSLGDAAVSVGTYIIRHAVPDDGAGYAEVFPVTTAGDGEGWVGISFPVVVSATTTPFELVGSGVQVVGLAPGGYDFPASGRIFVIPDASDLTSVLSVAYASFVVAPSGEATFTLTPGSVLDASGVAGPTDAAFVAVATVGTFLSGMTYPSIGQLPTPLPANNVVGQDVGTVGGFVDVTFMGEAGSHTFAAGSDLVDATAGSPASVQLGVAPSDASMVVSPTTFAADAASPIYLDVPVYMDLTGLADPTDLGTRVFWESIHGVALGGVSCLVPWLRLHGSDGSSTPGTGFRAQAGVFIEPTMPRPTTDLGNGEVKIVDAGHTASATALVGMRSPASFGLASSETVAFTVRRIRRFHDVLEAVGDNLDALRYAYEVRTGVVASYTASTATLVAAGSGTQLGAFTAEDVNVNPGDLIRLLDGDGVVVDTAEVGVVVDGTTLRLRTPGFSEAAPTGGESFEVYLRQAPVPHVQTNAQLLDLITERVILTRVADPAGDVGGRSDVTNALRDNGIADFSVLDPAPSVGDILLVDPAGLLEGPTGAPVPAEYGARPVGDQSVSTRADGSHVAGGPSDLDDNRGWYRIVEDPADTQAYLAVSGVTEFTGTAGAPVFFGATAPTNQQFAVVPEITGSGLTGTAEGQMDLRPTKTALPSNSYQDGSYKSIEPFSYRIIRPTQMVSSETVDLVLLLRERMLSWVEKVQPALDADKQGSYYVFQRDEQASDVGSSTDPDAGVGVASNAFARGLSGLTNYAPFASLSDGLSVLDRRYWCLDARLDQEFPPYAVAGDPYASFEVDGSASGYTVGSGRPVAPDRVEEVLDRSDRLRALRYAWVKFRANRVDGTLPSIERFFEELPGLLQEQEDLLRLQQSLQGVE